MPFTNIDLVKKHLLQHRIGLSERENLPVKLTASAPFKLPEQTLVASSEKIKGKEQVVPTQETIDFSGGDTVQLQRGELIPDTVVVSSDSSLGSIYVENVDFHVDYDTGRITLLSTGSIPSGSSAVIWYLYFRVYQAGTDYDLDYSNGEITIVPGGAIEDGQWAFVDYQVEFGFFGDDLIANAIVEADAEIRSRLQPAFQDATDQNLITGETYWAVSILCNIKSLEALNLNLPGNQAKALSDAWGTRSESYRQQALAALLSYIQPLNMLQAPIKVTGHSN